MVKHLEGRDALINDLEGDANVESDCEGELAGACDGTPNKEETEEETRAVLITGSFAAYVRDPISSSHRGK